MIISNGLLIALVAAGYVCGFIGLKNILRDLTENYRNGDLKVIKKQRMKVMLIQSLASSGN